MDDEDKDNQDDNNHACEKMTMEMITIKIEMINNMSNNVDDEDTSEDEDDG